MKQAAIYVHIPFCLTKCRYCTFNSYAGLDHWHERYIGALVREIAQSARLEGPLSASSVYIGGGTPTVLKTDLLRWILDACNEHFTVGSDAETTVEANPGTVEFSDLDVLRTMGINRLSVGVQSFDDQLLALLGRSHDASRATETYHGARKASFDNINLDLIYGLPTQSLTQWKTDLSTAVDLGPEHLSLYCLTMEQDTDLARLIVGGELPHPNPDLAAAMYECAQELLADAGYVHYEISNWAVSGRQCQHNLIYWLNRPYFGFGAGAHSYNGRLRYHNVLAPQEYVRRVEGGQEVVAGSEEIDRATELSETMIMGLRLCRGVAFSEFEERFDVPFAQIYGDQTREMVELGLLEMNGSGVRLTPRGRLLGNDVFERFLPLGSN